jgi:hypothetical protein
MWASLFQSIGAPNGQSVFVAWSKYKFKLNPWSLLRDLLLWYFDRKFKIEI